MRGGRWWLLATCTGLITLLGLELGARVVELSHDLIADPGSNSFVRWANRARVFREAKVADRAVYQRTSHHWVPKSESFPVEKDTKAFRVFCLGGSAAMGWPHSAAHAYPALLGRKLEALVPERQIEVINVAGNTYGSHRVKLVFDEVIEYEPDLVLIYSGNNEFLEDFVYGSGTGSSPWQRLALVRMVSRLVTPPPVLDAENYGEADQVVNRLSFMFGRASRLREDPGQFEKVRAHYRYNIESMLESARERGVAVMLLTVPVNLKDWVPNVSEHRPDMGAEELRRWRREFGHGLEALEAGNWEAAAEALRKAVEIDESYAEGHFRLGAALLRLGRIEEATREYAAALEWDAYPFRSLPQFRAILKNTAERHGVPLVDVEGALARLATDGIPGYDVLADYVHPTVESNEEIAHQVLLRILVEGLLPAHDPADAPRFELELGPEEELVALRGLLGQHLVMRQYDRLPQLAVRTIEAARRVDLGEDGLRRFAQQVQYVLAVVEPYRRLLRAEQLGTVAAEFTPEGAQETFRTYAELVHRMEAGNMSDDEFRAFLPETSR